MNIKLRIKDAIATVLSEDEEVKILRDALAEIERLERLASRPVEVELVAWPECHWWNINSTETGLEVCKNWHEKGQPCEYEPLSGDEILDIIASYKKLLAVAMAKHRHPPSVPEKLEWDQLTGRDGLKYSEGWNACRHAMIAAAATNNKGDV